MISKFFIERPVLANVLAILMLVIGAVVFVAPNLSDTLGGASISKTTTALLFVVGACFGLVQSIPILLNANSAADRIERLERELRETAAPPSVRERWASAPSATW